MSMLNELRKVASYRRQQEYAEQLVDLLKAAGYDAPWEDYDAKAGKDEANFIDAVNKWQEANFDQSQAEPETYSIWDKIKQWLNPGGVYNQANMPAHLRRRM